MINIWHLQSRLDSLETRYNPENDIVPGQPVVSYADIALLEVVRDLLKMVEDLQKQILELGEVK